MNEKKAVWKDLAEFIVKAMDVEEYSDKITWGPAGARNEFRFNSSNLEESTDRLANFKKIQEEAMKIGVVEVE